MLSLQYRHTTKLCGSRECPDYINTVEDDKTSTCGRQHVRQDDEADPSLLEGERGLFESDLRTQVDNGEGFLGLQKPVVSTASLVGKVRAVELTMAQVHAWMHQTALDFGHCGEQSTCFNIRPTRL